MLSTKQTTNNFGAKSDMRALRSSAEKWKNKRWNSSNDTKLPVKYLCLGAAEALQVSMERRQSTKNLCSLPDYRPQKIG